MRGPHERRVNLERKLRRQSSDAETRLWLCLRDRRLCGSKFVRQEAIESYVVDFICRERRLIIEVDGGQHADNQNDRDRDRMLSAAGYRVLRFWNTDVLKNQDGVLQVIADALEAKL